MKIIEFFIFNPIDNPIEILMPNPNQKDLDSES